MNKKDELKRWERIICLICWVGLLVACAASIWMLVDIAYTMDRLGSMTKGYVVLLRVRAPNGTLGPAVSMRMQDYMLWTFLPFIESLVVLLMFNLGLLVLERKFWDKLLGKRKAERELKRVES